MDLQNDNRTPRDRVDDDFRRFLTETGDGSFTERYERADDAIPVFSRASEDTAYGSGDGCVCTAPRTAPVTVRLTGASCGCGNVVRGDTPSCGCGNAPRNRSGMCGCGGVTPENTSPCGCGNVIRGDMPSCGCGGEARESTSCGCGREADEVNCPRPSRCGCTGLSRERRERMAAHGCPMPGCGENPVGTLDSSVFPLAMVYSPVQTFDGIMESCCALDKGTVFAALDLPFCRAKCRKGAAR